MRGKPHMDKWGKKIKNYIDNVMGDSKHFDYLVEEYFQPHKCNEDYLIYKVKNPFSESTRSAYSKEIPVDDGKKLRDGVFDGEEFLARLRNSLKDSTLELDDPEDEKYVSNELEELHKKFARCIEANDYLMESICKFFNDPEIGSHKITIPLVIKGNKPKNALNLDEDDITISTGALIDLAEFGDFDPLRDDFDEWVEENNIDPDGNVAHMLQNEHNKNKSKRSDKNHPMESLDPSDKVGIFPISYVEYLEKQNDLLRKNAKGGDDGEK